MKLKKLLPGILLVSALGLAGCTTGFGGTEYDYSGKDNLNALTSNGSTPGYVESGSVSAEDYSLTAGASSNEITVVVNSTARLEFDRSNSFAPLDEAFELYKLEDQDGKKYPVRTDKIAASVENVVENISEGDVETTITLSADLSDYKINEVALVTKAGKLTYKVGGYVLNLDGNETAGEESDNAIEYLPVDDYTTALTSLYSEDFAPVYSFDPQISFAKDDESGKNTGAVKVTVPAYSFGSDVDAEAVSVLNKVYSVEYKAAGTSSYKSEALSFAYDSDSEKYTAVTSVYKTGTNVRLVINYASGIEEKTVSEKYFGHSAYFSYFTTSYKKYSSDVTVGYYDEDTSTIVSTGVFDADYTDAENAQNAVLTVEKEYTVETGSYKGGVEWTVSLDSAYASAFEKTEGFIVTTENYRTVSSTVEILESNEDGKAVKVKVSVDDVYKDASGYRLWVGKDTVLSSNLVNEKQIYFGTTEDSLKADASGYVCIESDTGANAGSSYYSLEGTFLASSGKVYLTWNLTSGNSAAVAIYRNGVKIYTTQGTEYYDNEAPLGTVLYYQLKNVSGNVSYSDSVSVKTVTADTSKPFILSYIDNTESGSGIKVNVTGNSDSYVYGYLYKNDSNTWNSYSTSYDSSYTDSSVYGGGSYTYVMKDSSGNVISNKLKVKVADYDYSFNAEFTGSKVYLSWNRESGPKVSTVYVYVDGEQYTYTSNSYCNWSSYEKGKTYTYTIKDSQGNKLADSKSVTISSAFYSLTAAYPDGTYNKVDICWSETSGLEAQAVNLWKNGELYKTAEELDGALHFVEDAPASGTYVYYLTDADGVRVSTDYTATVPEKVTLNVVVSDLNVEDDKFQITIHSGSLWSKELWNALGERKDTYTESNLTKNGTDRFFENGVSQSSITEGNTLYYATTDYYVIDRTVTVTDTEPSTDLTDWTVYSFKSSTSRYYKLDGIKAGNVYTLQLYNGYSSVTSSYSEMSGTGSYNFYTYSYLYIILNTVNSDGTLTELFRTDSEASTSFVAEEDTEYVVQFYNSSGYTWGYSIAFHPYDSTADAYNVTDVDSGNTYKVPSGNFYGYNSSYVSKCTGTILYTNDSTESSNLRETRNRLVNYLHGQDENYLCYVGSSCQSLYTVYSDSAASVEVSTSDFTAGADIYVKKNTIDLPDTAKATSFSQFIVNDSGEDQYFAINPEDSIYYYVECIYKGNKSNYSSLEDFDDEMSFTSNYNYARIYYPVDTDVNSSGYSYQVLYDAGCFCNAQYDYSIVKIFSGTALHIYRNEYEVTDTGKATKLTDFTYAGTSDKYYTVTGLTEGKFYTVEYITKYNESNYSSLEDYSDISTYISSSNSSYLYVKDSDESSLFSISYNVTSSTFIATGDKMIITLPANDGLHIYEASDKFTVMYGDVEMTVYISSYMHYLYSDSYARPISSTSTSAILNTMGFLNTVYSDVVPSSYGLYTDAEFTTAATYSDIADGVVFYLKNNTAE